MCVFIIIIIAARMWISVGTRFRTLRNPRCTCACKRVSVRPYKCVCSPKMCMVG